jgi:hypothetical protein
MFGSRGAGAEPGEAEAVRGRSERWQNQTNAWRRADSPGIGITGFGTATETDYHGSQGENHDDANDAKP